jgi:hypothetical protein
MYALGDPHLVLGFSTSARRLTVCSVSTALRLAGCSISADTDTCAICQATRTSCWAFSPWHPRNALSDPRLALGCFSLTHAQRAGRPAPLLGFLSPIRRYAPGDPHLVLGFLAPKDKCNVAMCHLSQTALPQDTASEQLSHNYHTSLKQLRSPALQQLSHSSHTSLKQLSNSSHLSHSSHTLTRALKKQLSYNCYHGLTVWVCSHNLTVSRSALSSPKR